MRWRSFLVSFSCISAVVFYSPQASAGELATDIANHYIRSFPSESKELLSEEEEKEQAAHETKPVRLEEKTRREVVFNRVFTKSGNYDLLQQKMAPILNKYAWGDLKLFYGTTSTPAYHLLGRLNRTTTMLGEGVLATMLVTPTVDIPTLHRRQQIIQSILDSKEAVDALKDSLKRYQAAEQGMLSLWTSFDPLYTKEYRKYMDEKFYAQGNSPFNKSAGWLEFKKRFLRDFLGIQLNFIYPAVFIGGAEMIIRSSISADSMAEVGSLRSQIRKNLYPQFIPFYNFYDGYQATRKVDNPGQWWIGPTVINGFYVWRSYAGFSNYLEYSSVLRNLALRMADVQAFVVAATEISEQIAASPQLEEAYSAQLTSIRKLLAQSQENTELGRLVYYLKELPYNAWSYFFNNAGRLLASHKLFVEYKDEFVDAMYELGALDAYLSIATLVQEARENEATKAYVFTKFLDRKQRDKPYVKLDAMWNPFLDSKIAVGNSIEMGGASGGVRNVILTGPNAGGKSTFLTGVTISLLLSQTFGIAPAKEMVITPFDRINTYIDIADDIAAGKSLFMAEVDRAQEHLKILADLKPAEFSFTIFDEPFSGTNPTEGAAAEYSILETMADHVNTLNIVATHYPLVMLLEKNVPNKGFANYKVYITRKDADKKLNYTYKVVPGKSNQAIAIDILEEQGYDTRLLKRAREIIEHPERYKSSF